MLKLLIWQY